MSTDDIMRIIEVDPYANVTFTGGDPMYQPEGFAELARAIRQRTTKDIWCFTGFTYETLLHNPRHRQLLELIDVLVDGPFIKSLRDETLLFRGSSNQRLIDVPQSLKAGRVVLFQPDV
jgi:anaerobic ribonucleoside-triphosphate reductase activating protein